MTSMTGLKTSVKAVMSRFGAIMGMFRLLKSGKCLKGPRGVLQITPESLESLIINKHADIPRLFGDLRYVVIDELHSFLRSDRGGQTFCLLERLNRLAGVKPRRIGLSATIGDPESGWAVFRGRIGPSDQDS